MISCLNCAEPTDNHAICDKCFAAAQRGDNALARRSACKKSGYTSFDEAPEVPEGKRVAAVLRAAFKAKRDPVDHKEGG